MYVFKAVRANQISVQKCNEKSGINLGLSIYFYEFMEDKEGIIKF